ncbi:MAG TPA: PKD domain-containing protein, partial [Saprospiraceae bacterium]|nr:PKD domain-containing protein [Saprospiraceae bacterium]
CNDISLLYDFDLVVGQSFQGNSSPLLKVEETGQVTLLNGESRRWIRLKEPYNGYFVEWIEGIGDIDRGLIPNWYDFEGYDIFTCARDASGDLWMAPGASAALCDSLSCPLPKPAFVVADNDGVTVNFLNTSRDGDSWLWDFGDGNTSTDWNPQHTYLAPGCYDVCLSLSSPCLSQVAKTCHPVAIDQERRWKKLPFPGSDQGALLAVSFPHPDTGWVLQSRHIWKTTDGGQHWMEQNYPPNPPGVTRTLLNLNMTTPQLGIITAGNYVSGPGTSPLESSILVTTDGGLSWQDRNPGDHAFIFDGALRTDGRGYATHGFGSMLTTNDYGANWTELLFPTPFLLIQTLLYWQNDTIVGSGQLGLAPNYTPAIVRSFDGGNTWNYTLFPDWNGGLRKGYFTSGSNGWLNGEVGSLWFTDDAGQSWNNYGYVDAGNALDVQFADAQNGWATGGGGLVLHTADGGASWVRENCGFEDVLTDVDAVSPELAYAVSNGGEVFVYCTGSCMSVIKSRSNPVAMVSLQVSPNPAAESFKVDIPQAGRLLLCDGLGRVVWTSAVSAGEQTVPAGELSPGVWVLKLSTESGVTGVAKVFVGR